MRFFRLIASWAILTILSTLVAEAGTVTGVVTTSTSGPVVNGVFTFTLTQAAVQVGTATIVTSPTSCYTDSSGNVVGEPNPLVAPVVNTNTSSGTLAAGTYFTVLAYSDASGTTFYSPETTTVLSAQGSLIVTAPVRQPAGATTYKVFISATTGTETLQSTVSVSPGSWPNYTQSTSLAAGSALPASNTTACKILFNDQLTPSFTGYNVGLSNQSGSAISGFPQKWYLSGGASGTVNLSSGTPLYSGITVQYPPPILSTPAAQGLQSINGPLSLGAFPFDSTNFLNKGFEKFTEIAAPTCAAGFELVWADVAAHRLKHCDNGGAAVAFTSDTGLTVGQVPKANASGVLVPSGTTDDGTTITQAEAVKGFSYNSVLWVDGIKYTTLAGCYSDIPSTGGVCKVPPGYAETLAADVLMTKSGAGFAFQGPAIITQGTKQFKISAGTSGAFIIGPMDQGGQACVTLPCTTYTNSTEFIYTGSSTAVVVGAATPQTQHAEIHGIYFNLTGAGNSAIAVDLINVAGHFNVSKNIVIGSGGASNAQVGFLTDGGGTNFTCDGELDENFAINTFIGFQTANMSCENVYKGNQIAMTPGVPANSICMDFESNNFGNVVLGGNFSGCTTVLKVAGTGNANYFLLPINTETNDANFGGSTSGNITIYLGQAGAASNNPPVVTDTGTNNTFWSPNGLKIDSTGKIATYNAIATVGNGVASEFGKIDRTGDNNNVGSTTIYAVPSNGAGAYRIHLYQIVTTVAATSSTLPSVVLAWTDKNNSAAQTFTATSGAATGNSLTTVNFLSLIINAKASTNISFTTTGYASNAANVMQYATLITAEKL